MLCEKHLAIVFLCFLIPLNDFCAAGRSKAVILVCHTSCGRVTIGAKKNRVVGHPVQQNVLYIKMFGIICSI